MQFQVTRTGRITQLLPNERVSDLSHILITMVTAVAVFFMMEEMRPKKQLSIDCVICGVRPEVK